jgi:hypothetical protein
LFLEEQKDSCLEVFFEWRALTHQKNPVVLGNPEIEPTEKSWQNAKLISLVVNVFA